MIATLNLIKLIYPPISNQFAEWLSSEQKVREYVKRSRLYMLGQRHEVLYNNYVVDKVNRIIKFDLVCAQERAPNLQVSINDLTKHFRGNIKEYEIDLGERHIKISNPETPNQEPIYWATTDKLLYDFWRKRINILGLNSVRPFTNYQLYYVGISKKNDSFSRLFDSGHKNRLKILSNETQFTPNARLTDEIYIFLFDVVPMTLGKSTTLQNLLNLSQIKKTRFIADAEKAFVHILKSKYNEVKYPEYPKGSDGLYSQGLDKYGYVIDEDITFTTDKSELRGLHGLINLKGNQPDFVYINGDSVELMKSPFFNS